MRQDRRQRQPPAAEANVPESSAVDLKIITNQQEKEAECRQPPLLPGFRISGWTRMSVGSAGVPEDRGGRQNPREFKAVSRETGL
jgi:hypothetical protein